MPRPLSTPLALALAAAACSASPRSAADLVFRGGVVWTGDSLNPEARAVAIRRDRIVYVGDESGVDSLIGPGTRVVALGDRMLMPGFVDTHVHPVSAGVQLGECNLADVATLARLREVVAECNARDPKAPWIRGGAFPLSLFPGGTPTAAVLDSLVPDRPAFLSSADGHNGWANTRALTIAGITRDTPDPVNGVIVRDAQGNAVGTLRESAQDLVEKHIPPHTREEMRIGLERAVQRANQLGITTWHEASASEAILRAYADADSLGTLTVRTIVSLHVDVDSGPEQVQGMAALRARYERPMVRPVAAKIFADGVLEGATAALLAPYTDRPGFRGELNLPQERFDAIARALDSAGFKIHVHAIGDRAIRASLDAIAQRHGSRATRGGPRPVIAHLQLFDSTDIPRFAALGVVASFQPLWAWRDGYMRDLTEPRIGARRARWQYPMATMARTGAIMAAGSDWFVSSLDPLAAIQVAVTRQSPDDSTDVPFFPEERVDVATMLRAYTLGGAMAGDAERESGTIEVGKLADLIVLAGDIRKVSPYRIGQTPVVMTFVGGREVWQDSTAQRRALWLDPSNAEWRRPAPAVSHLRFETTKGVFVLELVRDHGPIGADRLYNLARLGYYDDTRFHRVRAGYIAQFGLHGDSAVNTAWKGRYLADDPPRSQNRRGTFAFAYEGPGKTATRNTQVYVNLADNARNDVEPFTVLGTVVEGMSVVDALYAGYGEESGGGVRQGKQGPLEHGGNAFMDREYPRLDRIIRVTVRRVR